MLELLGGKGGRDLGQRMLTDRTIEFGCEARRDFVLSTWERICITWRREDRSEVIAKTVVVRTKITWLQLRSKKAPMKRKNILRAR